MASALPKAARSAGSEAMHPGRRAIFRLWPVQRGAGAGGPMCDPASLQLRPDRGRSPACAVHVGDGRLSGSNNERGSLPVRLGHGALALLKSVFQAVKLFYKKSFRQLVKCQCQTQSVLERAKASRLLLLTQVSARTARPQGPLCARVCGRCRGPSRAPPLCPPQPLAPGRGQASPVSVKAESRRLGLRGPASAHRTGERVNRPEPGSAEARGHPQSDLLRVGGASGSHPGAQRDARPPATAQAFQSSHPRAPGDGDQPAWGPRGDPGSCRAGRPTRRRPRSAALRGQSPPWGGAPQPVIPVPSVGAVTRGAVGRALPGSASPRQPLDSEPGRERRFSGRAGDRRAGPGPRRLRRDKLAPRPGTHRPGAAPVSAASTLRLPSVPVPCPRRPGNGCRGPCVPALARPHGQDHQPQGSNEKASERQSAGRGETLAAVGTGVCECASVCVCAQACVRRRVCAQACVRTGTCVQSLCAGVAAWHPTLRSLQTHTNAFPRGRWSQCERAGRTAALAAPRAGGQGTACGVLPQGGGVPSPRCGDTYPRWGHTAPAQATYGTSWRVHSPALARGPSPRHAAAATPT